MTQTARAPGSTGALNYHRGLYYVESGAIPPAAPIMALLIGGAIAIVGGIVYGYADHYIGFIYIEALMTLAFGAVIGWVTARVMIGLRVRNLGAITIFTFITALIGYYTAWVGWLAALIGDTHAHISMLNLATRPLVMWRVILKINEVGAWGFSHDSPVNGIPLWIVWFFEAAMIFLTSLAVARSVARKRPFCETCGKWTTGPRTLSSTAIMDQADLKQRLESHQLDFVSQLPIYSGTDSQYFEWNAYRCDGCNNFNTLSIVRTQVKRDKRGKTTRTKKTIVNNLLVSPDELERISSKPVPIAAVAPGGPMPAARMPAPPPIQPVPAPLPAAIAPPSPPLSPPAPKSEPQSPTHGGKLLDL